MNERVMNIYLYFCFISKASDADSTPSITFVLRNIGGNTDSDLFNVQTIGNRANITVKGSLDYETKNLYQFILTTVDGQNSASVFASATITVHVLVSHELIYLYYTETYSILLIYIHLS